MRRIWIIRSAFLIFSGIFCASHSLAGDAGQQHIAGGTCQMIADEIGATQTVMSFTGRNDSYLMNRGTLDTGGDLQEFTVELVLLQKPKAPVSAARHPAIFSYASRTNADALRIWDPSSLRIDFANNSFRTRINLEDGVSHRLSVTWISASGELVLFDNGNKVWSAICNQGGVLEGNGKLALAQSQRSFGGRFRKGSAYKGQIVSASLANFALTPDQVKSGPIQTVLKREDGLVTHVVAANKSAVDTTGRHYYEAGRGFVIARCD